MRPVQRASPMRVLHRCATKKSSGNNSIRQALLNQRSAVNRLARLHLQMPDVPQPLMPGSFRPVYMDLKGKQSLEQLGLAIKMLLAEPAARSLFAAVFK
jgi:hypothetical protein